MWDPYTNQFDDIEQRFLKHANLVGKEAAAEMHLMQQDKRARKLQELLNDRERKAQLDAIAARTENAARFWDFSMPAILKTFMFKLGQKDTETQADGCSTTKTIRIGSHPMNLSFSGVLGITVLASLVIEDISNRYPISQTTSIAFAYCSYRDESFAKDPKKFLTTFILQLARQRDELFPSLVDLYITHQRDARKPSFSSLRNVLLSMLDEFDTLFLLFDTLDECEQRQMDFIPFLQDLVGRSNNCCVKLFITSRKEADIEKEFSNTPKIEIEALKVAEDIEDYVKYELRKRLESGELRLKQADLQQSILENLCGRAQGMRITAQTPGFTGANAMSC
ncbi:hypothetical protein BDD12DRAFT_914661 [Trichophaea hybrida]|nr:hypothetical protein BDD12DRAFT_914661 [Trichophaea hybrida]